MLGSPVLTLLIDADVGPEALHVFGIGVAAPAEGGDVAACRNPHERLVLGEVEILGGGGFSVPDGGGSLSVAPNRLVVRGEVEGRACDMVVDTGASVTVLDEGLYHADGQILDEVYVWGSFTQSKIFRAIQ